MCAGKVEGRIKGNEESKEDYWRRTAPTLRFLDARLQASAAAFERLARHLVALWAGVVSAAIDSFRRRAASLFDRASLVGSSERHATRAPAIRLCWRRRRRGAHAHAAVAAHRVAQGAMAKPLAVTSTLHTAVSAGRAITVHARSLTPKIFMFLRKGGR